MNPPDDAATRLELIDGLVIDELALERLRHQLSRAPDDVSAIAALGGDLPPGSSLHAHTQRSALHPLDDLRAAPPAPCALLLRAGTGCRRTEEALRPDTGRVLLDPGAFVHDTRSSPLPVVIGSREGRPVFPWRPVVLFLGCETDGTAAAWAADTADELVALEVDARLAVPGPSPTCRFSRPCLPVAGSVRALEPDVVVALDHGALTSGARWIPDHLRSTTIIAFDAELTEETELVSWILHDEHDRLRGTIGRNTRPATIAALVNRLCSGPQPRPPSLRLRSAGGDGDDRSEPLSIIVVTGDLDGPDERATGLLEAARSAGHLAEAVALNTTTPPAAIHADVLILRSVPICGTTTDLIHQRVAAQLPTVLDIGPGDLLSDTRGEVLLAERVHQLALECGRATTASSAVAALLVELGIEVLTLPTVSSSRSRDRLLGAERHPAEASTNLIGWRLDAPDAPDVPVIARSLHELLGRRPELIVQIVAEPDEVPAELLRHARVTATPGADDPATLATWSLQIWTPAVHLVDLTGDLTTVLEAGVVGVPTLVSTATAAGAADQVRHAVAVVDQPETTISWIDALGKLLDDPLLHGSLVSRSRHLATAACDRPSSVSNLTTLLEWVGLEAGR